MRANPLFQIPKSVLKQAPKPLIEIDFLKELPDQGFDKKDLEKPETLSLIRHIADSIAEKLGYSAVTNYGEISIFDKERMREYEKLVEEHRMVSFDDPADAGGKKKKKKKKK